MKISSDEEMQKFGADFFHTLKLPAIIQLIGDVGVGKTTFTRGLAKSMGIDEPVTSPSFTISKRYAGRKGNLIHYDFYRLNDLGLMTEDLCEAISEADSVVVIEWGSGVENLLPDECQKIRIKMNGDGTREITL